MEYIRFARLNEPDEPRSSELLKFGGYDDDEWDPSPETMDDFIRTFTRDQSDGDHLGSSESSDESSDDELFDDKSSNAEIIADITIDQDDDSVEIVADIQETDDTSGAGEFDNINSILERFSSMNLKNKKE